MRPQGRLKLGYFPLPDSEARNIARMLSFPIDSEVSIFDPCAGTGKALQDITAHAEKCSRYAVELDASRARVCKETGISTIHSDFASVTGMGTFSAVYCNPPYDTDSASSTAKQRLEVAFLESVSEWLAPGRLLIFVIPQYAIRACALRLSLEYQDIGVFTLTDPASQIYKQVVIFATRKRRLHEIDHRYLRHIESWASSTIVHESLEDAVARGAKAFVLKPAVPVRIYSSAMPLDEIEDVIGSSTAYKLIAPSLVPPDDVHIKQPPTPLHAGHIGLLCTAGLMNGIFGSGDRRHSARWRTSKYTVKLKPTDEEKEEGISRSIERFSTELCVLYIDGRYQVLGADKPQTMKAEPSEDEDFDVVMNAEPSEEEQEAEEVT